MRGSLNSAFNGCKTIDKIIHQEASDVEQKVKELQVKVGNLMIVIVDHVTLKDEEDSKATVVKTAEGIEQDIKELLRCGLRMVVSYGSDDITVFLVQSMRI
jgi:Zn finger protein HypA/HybF involved in hydrogenase expression